MRRRLTLLRHAKSSWADPGLDDFARPLNERGERDAPVMGRRLFERGGRPSLILTSPAVRARRTAQIIADAIGYPREFLQCEPELYLASPETIIEVIGRQDDSFRDLLVCGHNPGLSELANRLLTGGIDHLPTCSMVALDFDCASWADLPRQPGRLVWFDRPRQPAA